VGEEVEGKRAIVAVAAQALGLRVQVLLGGVLPVGAGEREGLLQLLGREAALARHVLLLDCDDLEIRDEVRERAVASFAEGYRGLLVLTGRERRRLPRCLTVPFEVSRPETDEQEELWRRVLGDAGRGLNGEVRRLAAQFDMSAVAIRAAGTEALGSVDEDVVDDDKAEPNALGKALWHACLGHARPDLEVLTRRIRPRAVWDDLVLPADRKEVLRGIAVHLRHRHRVYQDWGFAGRGERGLGISALFAGPSGTGKTMAAEVIAAELGIDLYRVDLASVVSKYIGETEKNLKKIFDAGEAGGAILLFDEADALFGKRSEVRDSHDRYANVEVSYLLQRIEQYRGLAVLTTNLKNAIDAAFLRRIRFVVPFPFPDVAARTEIWRRIFPAETPVNGLDVRKLARLSVAGGNIRNIALAAAFLAAEEEVPVSMGHLARAVRGEYAKLEKPLTTAEIGGWDL
jgi:AAA+ superfamily predicted ATPase